MHPRVEPSSAEKTSRRSVRREFVREKPDFPEKLCPGLLDHPVVTLDNETGPLLDCVAHVTRVSSQGVNHQVSVIRICLEILLYFDNSTAHISLSPEQKGPTGLKHFKVTTVQSVGDRE